MSSINTGSVTEDGILNASGQLSASDPDAGEASFIANTEVMGTYGFFNFYEDGTWNYSANNDNLQPLKDGEIVTESFTVSSVDGTEQSITITINGVNDVAIIGGITTGSITEDGILNASGELTINDPDAGEASFIANTEVMGTYGFFNFYEDGTWNYSANDEDLQPLRGGESVIDSFSVSSLDGTTQSITITVNGANDTAIISGTTTGSITEEGILTTNGSLTISDPDAEEENFIPQSGTIGAYGSFSIDEAGTWSYTADNSKLQLLKGGESRIDSFTLTSADGTSQTITITLNGVNDAPTLLKAIEDQTTAAGTSFSFTLPNNTFNDVDASDTLTLSATLADGSALPSWISFDASNGSFRATPTTSDIGAIEIRVTAADEAGELVSDRFSLTVQQPGNDAGGGNSPGGTITGETGIPTRPIFFSRLQLGFALKGTFKADKIKGNWKDNTLRGSNGNDILSGGFAKQKFGQDYLYGEGGHDRLYGGSGKDRLAGGDGNEHLYGGKRRDLLLGGKGNDLILGNADNDILVGGAGKDTLVGGSGKDMFVFNALSEGVDKIRGFEVERDVVDLRSIMARSEFSGTSKFDKYQKYVQLVQVGAHSEVRIDADGNGQGKDFVALASFQNLSTSSLNSTRFVI
jgi:VCBS repeat-containing protein